MQTEIADFQTDGRPMSYEGQTLLIPLRDTLTPFRLTWPRAGHLTTMTADMAKTSAVPAPVSVSDPTADATC